MMRSALLLLVLSLASCKNGSSPVDGLGERPVTSDLKPAEAGSGWVVMREEKFDATDMGKPAWVADPVPDDGPFADNGVYFKNRGISAPKAYRITQPFGGAGWLSVEAYSRSNATAYTSMVSIVEEPGNPANKVLRLSSPEHTDAVIVRPSQELPPPYRISLRVGHASFGDGRSGLNGYDGGETADPWLPGEDATAENGFYWLAILDAMPRPHNNVWIHHHRKIVIDSDNHFPPWMEIWNGSSFIQSGERPIMLFALDGKGQGAETTGKPFISYSAGTWQPSGKIRAVNRYKAQTWYEVSITREGDRYTVKLSGDFEFGGQQTYTAEIDAASRCVFHYNRSPLPAGSPCIDTSFYSSIGSAYPNWPAAKSWPEYFMFGDPHNNFYEGEVYYDDVRLEVFKP